MIDRLWRIALVLFSALSIPISGGAGEGDFEFLLERLHAQGATAFRYQETRTLELLASPWEAWGYMFSGADGGLVKLQLSPGRIIMAISGDHMYYYDSAHGQRHSAPLSFAGAMAQQIGAFKAVLQGRVEELRALYDIDLAQRENHWKVSLRPKTPSATAPTIEISGDQDSQRRHLLVQQPDGERTEYLMEKTGEGKHLEAFMQRLIAEAEGE